MNIEIKSFNGLKIFFTCVSSVSLVYISVFNSVSLFCQLGYILINDFNSMSIPFYYEPYTFVIH